MSTEPLHTDITVPLTPTEAFTLFTEGMGTWWPAEFSWSGQDALEDMGMEPRTGGFLYERGPHGFRLDWGRILAWEPPDRLVFTWQIGPDRVPVPDPARASEVEVTFTAGGPDATRVDVTHRHWDRHGDQGGGYREMFAQAWPYQLQRYQEAATRP